MRVIGTERRVGVSQETTPRARHCIGGPVVTEVASYGRLQLFVEPPELFIARIQHARKPGSLSSMQAGGR